MHKIANISRRTFLLSSTINWLLNHVNIAVWAIVCRFGIFRVSWRLLYCVMRSEYFVSTFKWSLIFVIILHSTANKSSGTNLTTLQHPSRAWKFLSHGSVTPLRSTLSSASIQKQTHSSSYVHVYEGHFPPFWAINWKIWNENGGKAHARQKRWFSYDCIVGVIDTIYTNTFQSLCLQMYKWRGREIIYISSTECTGEYGIFIIEYIVYPVENI